VEPRPFAEGKRQIPALYIMDLPGMDAALEWANKLPTYGCVEVRELLQFVVPGKATASVSHPIPVIGDGPLLARPRRHHGDAAR
jgi:hypothetical protein